MTEAEDLPLELGYKNLVQKLPLFNVKGFDEFDTRWYFVKIYIVVFVFTTIPFNVFYVFALLIIGLKLGVKTKANVSAGFLIEIIAVLGSALLCLINFFIIDRTASKLYVTAQVISTITTFVVSTMMAMHSDLYQNGSNSTSAYDETAHLKSAHDSLMVVVVLTYLMFTIQMVTCVVACRYRLCLIIKINAFTANMKASLRKEAEN